MFNEKFRKTILAYYRAHGRHDLPWRATRDPYRILVSEIMLQQTQVARVETYYAKWIKRFPDFRSLARAKTANVLRAWQGLGYNRRALALQNLSRIVLEKFNGKLPRTREELESLPGIGRATAGAVRAFAFNEPEAFIETNIRRVFIHFFFPRKKKVTDDALKRYIERTEDRQNPREWYWALMDYGAMLGVTAQNANTRSAHYKKQSRFAGSDREIRGKLLRLILEKGKMRAGKAPERTKKIINTLQKEGFIERKGGYLYVR